MICVELQDDWDDTDCIHQTVVHSQQSKNINNAFTKKSTHTALEELLFETVEVKLPKLAVEEVEFLLLCADVMPDSSLASSRGSEFLLLVGGFVGVGVDFFTFGLDCFATLDSAKKQHQQCNLCCYNFFHR